MKRKLLSAMILVALLAIVIVANKKSESQKVPNEWYRVSQNMPVGTVVTEAEPIGEGIYLIQIQMDSSNPEKPTRYSAVTAHPETFPVGSKATLRNVTATGDYAFGDMFHLAVTVDKLEGQ